MGMGQKKFFSYKSLKENFEYFARGGEFMSIVSGCKYKEIVLLSYCC